MDRDRLITVIGNFDIYERNSEILVVSGRHWCDSGRRYCLFANVYIYIVDYLSIPIYISMVTILYCVQIIYIYIYIQVRHQMA